MRRVCHRIGNNGVAMQIGFSPASRLRRNIGRWNSSYKHEAELQYMHSLIKSSTPGSLLKNDKSGLMYNIKNTRLSDKDLYDLIKTLRERETKFYSNYDDILFFSSLALCFGAIITGGPLYCMGVGFVVFIAGTWVRIAKFEPDFRSVHGRIIESMNNAHEMDDDNTQQSCAVSQISRKQ